jgi:hypothetical protein
VNSGTLCFLDLLLNALSKNASVENVILSNKSDKISLIDLDSDLFKFLEKNSTLKSLIFGSAQFSGNQMKSLNESLLKNDSLTELNFFFSNFKGPFEFLIKKNLKSLNFHLYVLEIEKFQDFSQMLKRNTSLKNLKLFTRNGNDSQIQFNEMIEILSKFETLETLALDNIQSDSILNFHELLKNPSLRELSLCFSINSPKSFELIMKALNENEKLFSINLSWNLLFSLKWDENIKIENKNLQRIDLRCNKLA